MLRRAGLSRLKDLDPAESDRRYERAQPGELVHLDTKKLGRFTRPGKRMGVRRHSSERQGWEVVHVAIDDRSRVAYTEIHRVQRVMTDNGARYRAKAFASACRRLGILHLNCSALPCSCWVFGYFRPYRRDEVHHLSMVTFW